MRKTLIPLICTVITFACVFNGLAELRDRDFFATEKGLYLIYNGEVEDVKAENFDKVIDVIEGKLKRFVYDRSPNEEEVKIIKKLSTRFSSKGFWQKDIQGPVRSVKAYWRSFVNRTSVEKERALLRDRVIRVFSKDGIKLIHPKNIEGVNQYFIEFSDVDPKSEAFTDKVVAKQIQFIRENISDYLADGHVPFAVFDDAVTFGDIKNSAITPFLIICPCIFLLYFIAKRRHDSKPTA